MSCSESELTVESPFSLLECEFVPPDLSFLVDDEGNFLVDDEGNFLIA